LGFAGHQIPLNSDRNFGFFFLSLNVNKVDIAICGRSSAPPMNTGVEAMLGGVAEQSIFFLTNAARLGTAVKAKWQVRERATIL